MTRSHRRCSADEHRSHAGTQEGEPRKFKVDHYFNIDAGEFARQHHLSVRAYCGVWISLSGYGVSRPLTETGIDKCRDCSGAWRACTVRLA